MNATAFLLLLPWPLFPQTIARRAPALPVGGGTQAIQLAGPIPSGFMIGGESEDSPPGYTFSGFHFVATGGPESWNTRAPLPVSLDCTAAAELNGKVYAVGGYSGGLLEYDTAHDTWTSKAPMPTPRIHACAAAVGGRLYVIGGLVLAGGSFAGIVEAYDPATNTWSSRAHMPTARRFLGAAVVNGRIYAVGGSTNVNQFFTFFATVEEYDPDANTWAVRAAIPTPRDLLAVVATDGKLYAIGGRNSTSIQSTLQEYDPLTNTWSQKPPMQTRRYNFAAAAVNGKVYAIFGSDENLYAQQTVEVFDPHIGTWSPGLSAPSPRLGMGAAAVDGAIYVIGDEFNPRTLINEQLDLGVRTIYLHRKN